MVAVLVRFIRWKALLPLSVVLGLIALWEILLADRTLKWAVESGGTAAVGARVDVGRATLGILDGHVTLEGLQVTDPNAPMTNMVEVAELIFDVGLLQALEKKIVIDSVAAREAFASVRRVRSPARYRGRLATRRRVRR